MQVAFRMLHAPLNNEWEPKAGANERLIGVTTSERDSANSLWPLACNLCPSHCAISSSAPLAEPSSLLPLRCRLSAGVSWAGPCPAGWRCRSQQRCRPGLCPTWHCLRHFGAGSYWGHACRQKVTTCQAASQAMPNRCLSHAALQPENCSVNEQKHISHYMQGLTPEMITAKQWACTGPNAAAAALQTQAACTPHSLVFHEA